MTAMLRARRRVSIVVAVLGLLGLGGCRMGPDPAVAAYVGSTEVTDARVNHIVDEFVGALAEEQRGQAGENRADLKNQVLHFLVLADVVGRYARTKKITVPPPDVKGIAEQQGLANNIELTEVLARYSAALGALSGAARSVPPTVADQREAYDHLATSGNQPITQSFEQIRQFLNEEALGRSLGLRAMLTEALADADVTVNPRYDATYRLPLQIEDARSWLGVELGGPGPVRDAPAPRTSQGASNPG